MRRNATRIFGLMVAVLCLAGAARGQNVRLEGRMENGAGKRVELYCYEDMLTMQPRLLDGMVADSAGGFSLACYLNYPRLVYVEVENYSQSFYAEPGRTYEVYLPPFRWEQDEELNVHLAPVALPLEFLNLPADELNLRMMRFEEAVDSGLLAYRVFLDPRFKPRREYADSLEAMCRQAVAPADSFFNRYVDFTLAQMRYAMGFASRRQVYDRCLAGREVLYHDECYMRLLLTLLDGMVSKGMRRVPKGRLVEWVWTANLEAYLDSLGTEPLLYDEQLRELAALKALQESWYDADYSRPGVRRMVERMAGEAKFAEHRQLAVRLLALLDHEERGCEWTDIVLPDVDGNPVALDSLRGKWVYLSFVRVTDPNSLREIETLAHFRDSVYRNHSDVVFVSVSCDREPQKMYHFLRNNKRGVRYQWTWLHFGGDYRLLERFGVVSFPTFVLLNPEGRQHYSVTPTPGDGFLLHAPWQKKEEPVEDTWGQGLHNWQRDGAR